MPALKNALLAAVALALALGGGGVSAWLVLRSPPSPAAGWMPVSEKAMRLQQPFALPLAREEGAAFTASLDGEGLPLSAACEYRVAGRFPPSRLWTLVATGEEGPGGVSALHSLETLSQPDDSDAVAVSRHPSPGNWLPLAAGDRFTLTLFLYGSMINDGTGFMDIRLPRIERLRCDE